jgi:sulfate permease, SulP family
VVADGMMGGRQVLSQFPKPPRIFILRLRLVPTIDASGVAALRQLFARSAAHGTAVIFSGLQDQPRSIPAQMGIEPDNATVWFAEDFNRALDIARRIWSPFAQRHAIRISVECTHLARA